MSVKAYAAAGSGFRVSSASDFALRSLSGHGTYKPVSDEFSEYELYTIQGWDGGDAIPISVETIQAARVFARRLPADAPRADIAPGVDGTIAFEWRLNRGSGVELIFVEVGPGMTIRAYRERDGRRQVWPPRLATIGAYTIASELFERA